MTTSKQTNIRWRGMLASLLVTAALTACANSPVSIAETPAQKGYAIERSYNIILEQALAAAQTDPRIRDAVQTVERRTTPVVDSLSDALADYEVARADFELAVTATAGNAPPTTLQRVTVAVTQLERWIAQAQRALVDLSKSLNP